MYVCVRIGVPYAHHVYETLICRSVQWQRAPYLAIVYIHTSRYPPLRWSRPCLQVHTHDPWASTSMLPEEFTSRDLLLFISLCQSDLQFPLRRVSMHVCDQVPQSNPAS